MVVLDKTISSFPFSDSLIKKVLTHSLNKNNEKHNIDLESIKVKTERLTPVLRKYKVLVDAEQSVSKNSNDIFDQTLRKHEKFDDFLKGIKEQLEDDGLWNKAITFGYDLVLLRDATNSEETITVSRKLFKTKLSYTVNGEKLNYDIQHRIFFPLGPEGADQFEDYRKNRQTREKIKDIIIKSIDEKHFWLKSVCSSSFWDFIKWNVLNFDSVEVNSEVEENSSDFDKEVDPELERLMKKFHGDYSLDELTGLMTLVLESSVCDDFINELGTYHGTAYRKLTTQPHDPGNRIFVQLQDYPLDIATQVRKAGGINYKVVYGCRFGKDYDSNKKKSLSKGIYAKRKSCVKNNCPYKFQMFSDRQSNSHKVIQFFPFHSKNLHPKIIKMPLVKQVGKFMQDQIIMQPSITPLHLRSCVINEYKHYLRGDDFTRLTTYSDESNKWIPSLIQCKNKIKEVKAKMGGPDLPEDILNLLKELPSDFQAKLLELLAKRGYTDTLGGMTDGEFGKWRVKFQPHTDVEDFYCLLIPESEALIRQVFMPDSKVVLIDATHATNDMDLQLFKVMAVSNTSFHTLCAFITEKASQKHLENIFDDWRELVDLNPDEAGYRTIQNFYLFAQTWFEKLAF